MENNLVFSKRLLYATVFGVVIIGGAFYFSQRETPTQIVTQPENVENILTEENYTTIAIEGDTSAETNTFNKANTNEPTLTETDILTRNVIGPYLEQSSTDSYSIESGNRIIADATKVLFTLDYTPLEPKDITTLQDSSKQSILHYKEALYEALKPIFELKEYELTIYARAIRDNNKEEFNSLVTIANTYMSAGDATLALSVPDEMSAVHLEIINALYKFTTVLSQLAKGYDDPAASLSGTGNFVEAEEDIQHAFSRLQTYFILKEVSTIAL